MAKLKPSFDAAAEALSLSLTQICILDAIGPSETLGASLRESLKSEGIHKSIPGFSDCMSRLERAGLIEGRHDTTKKDGRTIRQKFYSLTDEGAHLLGAAKVFFEKRNWAGANVSLGREP